MDNKNIGSLLSLPFFEGFNSDHVNNSISYCKEIDENTEISDELYFCMYNSFIFYKENIDNNSRENFKIALNIELVEYSINTGLINALFSPEEVDKIIFLVEKKQFNSKIIKSLINKLLYLSRYNVDSISKKLAALFQISINKRLIEIRKEKVNKEFLPLKKIVDNLTSGVSVNCYLSAKDQSFFKKIIPDELNNYIMKKYNYDFNNLSNNYLFHDYYSIILEKLSLALLDDKKFWAKVEYKYFIYGFLSLVIKYNSLTHATKIMNYIMDNLLKDEVNKFIIKNNYPLFINSKKLENKVIDRCLDYTFGRFFDNNTNNILKEEKENLLYPLRDYNAKIGINIGKGVFETFIKNIYKDDYEKVLNIFKNTKNIIQDGDNNRKRELSLEIVLESSMFGYHDIGNMDEYNIEKKYYYEYYDFGTNENILARFYYRVYLIDKYYKENSDAAIYEVFHECLNMIDEKYNTKCSYVHNPKVREKRYLKLKEILKAYNLDLKEENKNNYIIALLDRKTATSIEESMFSELEELGDAIYELGVINILFYQDEYKDIDYNELQNLVSAKEQIKVSNILGLDELYISSFNYSENSKTINNKLLKDNKFFADSLEMIVGSIAKEFGIQKALDFVMQIVLKANKKYKEPNIKEYNEDDILFSNIILGDYEKFYPSYLNRYTDYNGFYYSFGYTLEKILKIIVLGNETARKRYNNKLINEDQLFGGMQDATHKLTCYFLRYGIEKTIDKYREFILKNTKDL